jgi:purine-nucleoside phosphorylase
MRQAPPPSPLLPEAAQTAARRVLDAGLARSGFATARPRLGVILGTGMGQLVDRLEGEQSLPAAAIGWLPRATALGHAGRLAWGDCHGQSVVMLQGRVHAYEGQPAEMLIRGVDLLAALGVERLLVTNAAGGLAPGLAVGDLVVLEDHLDLVRRMGVPERPQPTTAYDDALSTAAVAAVGGVGLAARRGVYAYCLGPTYETRAEYRMLRRFGADVVGMSTVPEVLAAAGHGMRVVAASVVTNLARPDRVATGTPTDGDDVCRAAAAAADGVWAMVRVMLQGE